MKLISLYIENFGGLSKYSLELGDGLTVIEEANGFGKTTLAEFIRAMFYGFPRKAKTLDKSRRQKYTPWSGGKCGGNLVFEAEGHCYRVERTFGATPKSDTFTLIDLETNKKSDRYSEELGLELFQLDADSFERSTYMPQISDGNSLTTDAIHSKLSNLVEDTNDVGNFEKAVTALKAKRSTFVPYRGSGGSVMQAHGRVSQLQEQVLAAQSRKPQLEACCRKIEELEQRGSGMQERLVQVRKEIRTVSEAAAVAAVQRQHRHMAEELEAVRDKCAAFRGKYPEGIPDWERIETARNAAAQLEILRSRELTEQEDLDAAAFLEENRSRFGMTLPTQEELTACRNCCEEHTSLRNQAMELAEELAQQPNIKADPLPLILLVLAGMTAIVLKFPVVGALILVGSIIAASRFVMARKKLQQFHQQQAERRAEMERISKQAEQQAELIKAFLSAYGSAENTDYYGALAQLEHDREDYLRAKARVAQWQQDKEEHRLEVAHWEDILTDFFESANLTRQEPVRRHLLQIRDDRKAWEEAALEVNRKSEELKAFTDDNSCRLNRQLPEMAANPELLRQEETDLTMQLGAVSEELIRLRQNRQMLEEQIRCIPELQDELQYWQEKKTADQKNADLLDDTVALLEQAKENLSGSFMGPIRVSFSKLLERLWGKQEGRILVTPDLQVQLERSGAARELGYFSAGQTDMVMLCMRLALVDALFAQEKPFVILDDPFINLDDARTAEALTLLQELAKDRQIIYLTCNSSRTPK